MVWSELRELSSLKGILYFSLWSQFHQNIWYSLYKYKYVYYTGRNCLIEMQKPFLIALAKQVRCNQKRTQYSQLDINFETNGSISFITFPLFIFPCHLCIFISALSMENISYFHPVCKLPFCIYIISLPFLFSHISISPSSFSVLNIECFHGGHIGGAKQ